jgi:hypothetical protein
MNLYAMLHGLSEIDTRRNVSSQGFSAQDSSDCEYSARAVKPRLIGSSQETKKKL